VVSSGPAEVSDQLPILYQDATVVVVDKPSGLLVHRSQIDRHETRFAVQLLRNQLGRRVYPVHRLDKGVLTLRDMIRAWKSHPNSTRALRRTCRLSEAMSRMRTST
jgi:hypothetical protein